MANCVCHPQRFINCLQSKVYEDASHLALLIPYRTYIIVSPEIFLFIYEPLEHEATNYISILVSETEDGDHDSTMAPSTLTIKATAKRQKQTQRRQKQDEMHDIKDKVQDESEDNDFLEATTTTTTKTTGD